MRTTLKIDDDVLAAAKSLAAYEDKTAGQVISELARKGLRFRHHRAEEASDKSPPFEIIDGLPTLRSGRGVATPEQIQRLVEDDPNH